MPGGAGLLGAGHGLPLGEQQPVGAVRDDVDLGAVHLHAQRVELREVAGQTRPQPCGVVIPEQVVEGGAGHRTAEQLGRVRRRDGDHEVGFGDGKQDAVRLDGTGDGDRLVGAVEQRLLGDLRGGGTGVAGSLTAATLRAGLPVGDAGGDLEDRADDGHQRPEIEQVDGQPHTAGSLGAST